MGATVLGFALGRALGVGGTTSALIPRGTAICGGSAIAALGPVLGASREAMGVSLATVFVLNGIALYVFPVVGHTLGLSPHQFALWAALAIHDSSSVVGAAATYGPEALAEATVLKLARALWIAPLAVGAAMWRRRMEGVAGAAGGWRGAVPGFIGLFLIASAVRAAWPAGTPLYDAVVALARQGLVLTLFLIGAGLSRGTLRAVGLRPFVQGALLWGTVAGASLAILLAWTR